MPTTREVPESIRPFVAHHSAVLLANHGALAWGRDLWEAFDRMETVEQTAKIYAWVQLLGGGRGAHSGTDSGAAGPVRPV